MNIGDIVLGVDGEAVVDLATLFRRIWAVGAAGTEIPLHFQRGGDQIQINVQSVSRQDLLKSPQLH